MMSWVFASRATHATRQPSKFCLSINRYPVCPSTGEFFCAGDVSSRLRVRTHEDDCRLAVMMNDPFQSGLDAGLNSNSCDCKWLVVAEKELENKLLRVRIRQTQVRFLCLHVKVIFQLASSLSLARIVILY